MKIRLIIIEILIGLMITGLIGCTEPENSNESKFIGSWKAIELSYLENVSNFEVTWTFDENNSVIQESIYEGNVSGGIWEFNVDGNNLCLTNNKLPFNSTICYTYRFHNNSNTLTLEYQGAKYIVFNKVL